MLSPQTVAFLQELRVNNSRDWIDAHKDQYKAHWKEAGEAFASSFKTCLEERLNTPLNAKLFRLHRDLRFSKDKTPYHTHLHISVSAGDCADAPAFMFGVEPGKLSLGMGIFGFSKIGVEKWRKKLISKDGAGLCAEIDALVAGKYRFNAPDLKRVPAGYPADHMRNEWLRRKGLHVWRDSEDVEMCFGESGAQLCAAETKPFILLYEELSAL